MECCVTFLSERVDCYGVLEQPAHLLATLERRLGIQMPMRLPYANTEVTANGIAKSGIYDCLAAAASRNCVDVAIYSFALTQMGL